jgi:hypothetical protein
VFWIGKLDDGSMTREELRRAFVASPEFTGRVNAIIAAGTAPGVTCSIPGVDTDINGTAIPSPTGPVGATMCEFPGMPYGPGSGPGPCGSYQVPIGNCSSGMTGANAITKVWQYNLEDYQQGSPRLGNSIRAAIPRDAAMIFRFKTGPASAMGPLPAPTTDPNLLRIFNLGYSEQTNRGPSAPRFVTISESRCDFDYAKTLASGTQNGCYVTMTGDSQVLGHVRAAGTSTFPFCQLKPDTIYYVNIRYEDASTVDRRGTLSCPSGTCGAAIKFD